MKANVGTDYSFGVTDPTAEDERRETARPAVRCIYCNAPLNRREHETGDACGECATPGAGLPVADLGALLGLGRTLRAELL